MKSFNKPSTSIKNWAVDDRPREKLMAKGPAALSNSELIAILINNGNREKSAVELAREILRLGGENLNELGKLSAKELQKVKGIGVAKAMTIAAALELGRRRQAGFSLDKYIVKSSKDIAIYFQAMFKDLNHEMFAVIFLNHANKVKNAEIISRGGINSTIADPRIIIKKALEESATALILCHNHPSGNVRPSQSDRMLTKKIKDAAHFFDIKIIDHVIVGEDGFYSFADEGIL